MQLPREFERVDKASTKSNPRSRRRPLWRLFLPSVQSEPASLSDSDIVKQLIAGQDDALSVLIDRYCVIVFRKARNILGDDGEAEDIVERVFSEVHSAITEFDATKGSFVSWLLLRTLHRSLNRRDYLESRQFHRWVELPVELPADLAVGAATPMRMSRQELSHLINEALNELRPREREIFGLVHFDGLTIKEITALTKETVGSIRYSLQQATQKLRVVLDASPRVKESPRSSISGEGRASEESS